MAPSSVAIGSTASSAAASPETTMLPGPEHVGLPEPAVRGDPAAELVGLGLVEPQDAGHAAGRGERRGLHGLAAAADHLQAGGEVHRPGEDQGRVLAQAQAGRALAVLHDGRLARLQALERRQAGHEDRRLAHVGRLECLGRPLEAELAQVEAQDLAGAVEQGADGGQLLVQLLAHADGLGTLAGEQEGNLGHDR